MSKEELGGASDLETASRLYVELAEGSRHDSRKPITAFTSRVPRNPTRSPTLRTSIWATSCKHGTEHSIVRRIHDRNEDHRAKPKGG